MCITIDIYFYINQVSNPFNQIHFLVSSFCVISSQTQKQVLFIRLEKEKNGRGIKILNLTIYSITISKANIYAISTFAKLRFNKCFKDSFKDMSIHAHEQDMNNVQHVQNRTKLLQNRIITYKFVIHYLRIRHVLTSICSLTTFKKKCCIGWCLLIQVQ